MTISEAKRRKIENIFEYSKIIHTFANPFRKELLELILRYGVMVALQILALSVRVRVLLSQQSKDERLATGLIPQISDGGIAQLVRAHDS